jgi:hypothetical protein
MRYRCGRGHEFDVTETENRDLAGNPDPPCRAVLEDCADVGCPGGRSTALGTWVLHAPRAHMGRWCGLPSQPA